MALSRGEKRAMLTRPCVVPSNVVVTMLAATSRSCSAQAQQRSRDGAETSPEQHLQRGPFRRHSRRSRSGVGLLSLRRRRVAPAVGDKGLERHKENQRSPAGTATTAAASACVHHILQRDAMLHVEHAVLASTASTSSFGTLGSICPRPADVETARPRTASPCAARRDRAEVAGQIGLFDAQETLVLTRPSRHPVGGGACKVSPFPGSPGPSSRKIMFSASEASGMAMGSRTGSSSRE